MKSLAIIERAFRGTLEEQYSHILWLSYSLKKMKSDLDILLRGNSILFGIEGEFNSKVELANLKIEYLPDYAETVKLMLNEQVGIYTVQKDCQRLGISEDQLVKGIQTIPSETIGKLITQYDRVWYW